MLNFVLYCSIYPPLFVAPPQRLRSLFVFSGLGAGFDPRLCRALATYMHGRHALRAYLRCYS
ncbi:hypothetical protein PHAMO_210352 [Magnetospirillum molischianum DSM 120]|uniref:Uncharacterized protein n=1 Tax=Magnetospirillum molischianum DSM 120 TaxID=1150626 RepID=H8FR53_MAGML|nr:hypothetical protein PHAMO_210352 [Magnetospirillum molischianum DSM 120]